MADKALYVVGQKRFVATMRKAGADLKQLKEVNRQAAGVALPAVKALAPRGRTGRLAGSVRIGATQKAGIIRAGRKSVPYAGVINYGWPRRRIVGRQQWRRLHRTTVDAPLQAVRRQDIGTDQGSITHAQHRESHLHRRPHQRGPAHPARHHLMRGTRAEGGVGRRRRQPNPPVLAYLAMRFAGNTSKPYDQWLDDVDDIDVETPENPTE